MNNLVTSVIRTVVPYMVGGLVSFLATRGIELDPQTAAALGTFLTGLIGSVYYVVVRLLEQKFPQAGWLLGSEKLPQYKEPK